MNDISYTCSSNYGFNFDLRIKRILHDDDDNCDVWQMCVSETNDADITTKIRVSGLKGRIRFHNFL